MMLSKRQKIAALLGLERTPRGEVVANLSPRQRISAGILAMANATARHKLNFAEEVATDGDDFGVKAANHIYDNDAVSADSVTGNARQLVGATDTVFLGFAMREYDNTGSGSVLTAGAIIGTGAEGGGGPTIPVRTRGQVYISVAAGGVLAGSQADEGLQVYATDGQTFTGLNTGALKVGAIIRWISGTNYLVEFQATNKRNS